MIIPFAGTSYERNFMIRRTESFNDNELDDVEILEYGKTDEFVKTR